MEEKSLNDLKDRVKEFCEERDWCKFHNTKDLATGLSIEASELLEHFLWQDEESVKKLFSNDKKREEIEDELADVFYYVLRIAQRNNINLTEILERKIKKNAKNYPVEKAKGSNKKYTEYEND